MTRLVINQKGSFEKLFFLNYCCFFCFVHFFLLAQILHVSACFIMRKSCASLLFLWSKGRPIACVTDCFKNACSVVAESNTHKQVCESPQGTFHRASAPSATRTSGKTIRNPQRATHCQQSTSYEEELQKNPNRHTMSCGIPLSNSCHSDRSHTIHPHHCDTLRSGHDSPRATGIAHKHRVLDQTEWSAKQRC